MTAADHAQTNDKVAEKHEGAAVKPNFDALALMKEGHAQGIGNAAGAGDSKPGGASEKDQHLVMTDAFAGLQGSGTPETRGVKGKPHDAPHPAGKDHSGARPGKDSHGEKPASPTAPAEKDAADGQPVKVVGKPENFDPAKPTVVVLDRFDQDKEKAGGMPIETHGDVSAKGAEANGFNVYRVQTGQAPMGAQMEALEGKIKSGEIKLGKGDAVNVSLGPHDLPVEGTTKFFGAPTTNANLGADRDKVLGAIKEQATSSPNPAMRDTMSDVVRSNEAIQRLQDQGIRVVHAAGNEGPGKFSMHYLSAEAQLNSTKPNGTTDGFSADHGLTTRGDGVLPVTTRPPDAFSPRPIAQDKGNVEVHLPGGQTLSKPIEGFGNGYNGPDNKIFDRNKLESGPDTLKPLESAPRELPTSFLSGARSGPEMKFNSNPKLDFNSGGLKTPGMEATLPMTMQTKTTNANDKLQFTDAPKLDTTPRVAGVLAGTSYSNIGYFADHREEMERQKRGQ